MIEIIFKLGESSYINNLCRSRKSGRVRCKSIEKAQRIIDQAAKGAPEGGAYDKVPFTVTIEDIDFTYCGRLDLQRTKLNLKTDLLRRFKWTVANAARFGQELTEGDIEQMAKAMGIVMASN